MNQQLMTDRVGRSPQIKTITGPVRTSSIHQIIEPQKKSALQVHQWRGNHHRIDSCAHWTTHCDNRKNTR